MTETVLVASELKELLDDPPVPGFAVKWLDAEDETPGGDYPAIVPLLSRRLGASEFVALPRLRVVANCAVGVDNVDLNAARDRGIVVTNTPDVLTDATADLTWALILAVARRLKEGQGLMAAGSWHGWHPTQLLGMELRGCTLGIVGAGRIGQAVGRRAVGFGLHVCYAARSRKLDFEEEVGATKVELDSLFGSSDIVSLHLPSSVVTRALVDARRMSLMRGAILINTARGDLVDETALLDALERGRVGGAGLDVFAEEPDVSSRLVNHPRVVALPHIGSATVPTRRAMASLAVQNAAAVLAGRAPITPVPG